VSLRLRTIHKWLAVTVGSVFLAWLVSGIVMVLPPWSGVAAPRAAAALDLGEVKVSPGAAAATAGGASEGVTSVTLARLMGIPVYRVASAHGLQLVDARTGRLLRITQETAERLARLHFSVEGRVHEVALVTRHSVAYPWGPVPAYRIVFESAPGIAYYVSMTDGTVQRSDMWSWLRDAIVSIHGFEPLKLITKSDSIRTGLLVLFSLVGIGAALSGYYLVFRG